MAEYLIGLDNGTTSARATLFDQAGTALATASRTYACEYPRPGWVEQDVDMLDEANFEVLRTVIERSGVDPGRIASLGISTQRGLHLYVDAEGNVLRNSRGLSWQDARHGKQLDILRDRVGNETFHQVTGLPISAFWPAGKILWIAENEPDVLAGTHKILTTQEYFLAQLSDATDYFIDRANASLFGLMDIDTCQWSQALLDVVGVSEALLPTIVPSGHRVGSVTPRVAERTGLPVGLPVSTGGGDQQCAGVGAGVIEPGLCELTFGTAGNSVAYLAEPLNDPAGVITRSMHAVPDRVWEAEGIQAAAGAAYRWFRDNIGYPAADAEPFARTADPYEVINHLAQQSPVGANGLLFHPYLAGSLTPHYDEHARGGFLGLTLKHSYADLARAVLEGVCYEARDILTAYRAMGLDLQEIRLAGGATKSELWNQIQADVYGVPTAVLRQKECAVLGAAILGGIGAGVFGSVAEGVAATVHVERRCQPDPANHERYSKLWEVWRLVYRSLSDSGVYRALTSLQQ